MDDAGGGTGSEPTAAGQRGSRGCRRRASNGPPSTGRSRGRRAGAFVEQDDDDIVSVVSVVGGELGTDSPPEVTPEAALAGANLGREARGLERAAEALDRRGDKLAAQSKRDEASLLRSAMKAQSHKLRNLLWPEAFEAGEHVGSEGVTS